MGRMRGHVTPTPLGGVQPILLRHHLNPVRRGLVRDTGDWKWSSVHEHAGIGGEEQERRSGLRIDRVLLAADENTRI